jgi:tetratricopeptide (TPR) repeat protein
MRLHRGTLARLLASLLLSALLCNAGCNSLTKLGKGLNGPSAETAALSTKLGFYVDCLNSVDRGLHSAYHDYTTRVDRVKGPQAGHEPSLFVRDEIEPCFDKLKQGMSAPPALAELDAAAQNYSTALQKLAPVLKDAIEYYRQEDYKDDKLAKGKQLHAPLVAAFDEFDKASDQFHAALDAEDVRFKERELAEIEQKQGRNLSYLHRVVMLRAKQLVKLGEAEPIDPVKYQPALDAYSQAVEEASAYFNAHRTELGDRVSCWQVVERAARDFLKEGKEKLRNLRENKKPQPSLMGDDRFVDEYNDLIMMANNCSRML